MEMRARAMYKGELALAYNPTLSYGRALAMLNRWIEMTPGLQERLAATGWRRRAKMLTPLQVQMMMDAFGAP